jgi:hypothetical protein
MQYLITQIVANELVFVEQAFAAPHLQETLLCGKDSAKQKEFFQQESAQKNADENKYGHKPAVGLRLDCCVGSG